MGISVEVGNLKLKNPLILSSAGYTATAKGIQSYVGKGFGAVYCKTVTAKPLAGAPSPRVFWYDKNNKTMLSGAEALKNPGVARMSEAIEESKAMAEQNNCAIIGSISGSSLEELADNAEKLSRAGASAIEIDMACPSTGPHLGEDYINLGSYWAKNSELAIQAINVVKNTVNIPVWVKAPLGQLLNKEFVQEVDEKARPDAYSFVGGRIPCLVIDTDTREPVLSGNVKLMLEKGIPVCPMVTGPVRPSTIYHTLYISYLTKTPLIPTGGLTCGDDIIQAIMAGATATGICKAVYRDANASRQILADIEEYVNSKGIADYQEIRGVVKKHLPGPPRIKVQMVW